MHQLTQDVSAALRKMEKDFCPRNWKKSKAVSDLQHWNELIAVYNSLGDEESKKTFTKLVIFRLAWQLVPQEIAINKFGFFSIEEWSQFEEQAKSVKHAEGDCIDDRIESWIVKGYEHNECRVSEGDVVIDGGAFTGNTALYFSQLAGESGVVYSFEPTPETYEKLCENVKEYANIIPIHQGLAQENAILRFSYS